MNSSKPNPLSTKLQSREEEGGFVEAGVGKEAEDNHGEEDEVKWDSENVVDEDAQISFMLTGKLWTVKKTNAKALMDTLKNI